MTNETFQKHVLEEFSRVHLEISKVREDVATLKAQAFMWGSFAGLLISIITSVLLNKLF